MELVDTSSQEIKTEPKEIVFDLKIEKAPKGFIVKNLDGKAMHRGMLTLENAIKVLKREAILFAKNKHSIKPTECLIKAKEINQLLGDKCHFIKRQKVGKNRKILGYIVA